MKYELIYNDHTTFEDVLRVLDANGTGFLTVVDKDRKLLGVITDGDIRRAILNKKTNLAEIWNSNPKTLPSKTTKLQAVQFLKSIHRRHVPLVTEDNTLVDIVTLDDVDFNAKANVVVIMAGGLGTRLGSLTKDVPKPMLPIGGKPMLELIIKGFQDFGYFNFVICVNYLAEVIMDYFGDGSRLGINIEYTIEKEKLGTAGALSLLKRKIEDPFFVINGDVMSSVNYEEFMDFHVNKKATASMCVKKFEYQIPFAEIKTNQENFILEVAEKPTYSYNVNAGIYILNPETIELIPKAEFYDMPSLFENIISLNKPVSAFITNEYWLDVGHVKDYEKAVSIFNGEI